MNNSAEGTSGSVFRRVWPVLKWALFALVLLFVGRKAWQLWRDGDVGSVQIHWPWLLAACGLYVVGWLPSVLFWHRLIHGLRGTSSLLDVAHAFFAGHLGKYVPGKASVLLIRAGILGDRGCRPGMAALTSTYEVLVCMGVGAAVGLTLAPLVWPRQVIGQLPTTVQSAFEYPLALGVSVVCLCIVLVPTVAVVLGGITARLAPVSSAEAEDLFRESLSESEFTASARPKIEPTQEAHADEVRVVAGKIAHSMEYRLTSRSLLGWCFAFVVTWLIHGLSLGCTLRAVGVETSLPDWLTWTGDVCSASVLGFVAVFAPGGLGVREGVLIGMLKTQPGINPSQAVAAAALLRVVWLAGEIMASAGLGWFARRPTNRKSQIGNPQSHVVDHCPRPE